MCSCLEFFPLVNNLSYFWIISNNFLSWVIAYVFPYWHCITQTELVCFYRTFLPTDYQFWLQLIIFKERGTYYCPHLSVCLSIYVYIRIYIYMYIHLPTMSHEAVERVVSSSPTWFLFWTGLHAASGSGSAQVQARRSAAQLVLSSASLAPPGLEAGSILGLRSGHAQYSAQSLRRTAGERNTTILSHSADVPVLLDPPPPSSFRPPPFWLYSNSCLLRRGLGGVFLPCVCGWAEEGGRMRWKWCKGWRKQRWIHRKVEEERDSDRWREIKLCLVSEYNLFSYRPLFPWVLCFPEKVKQQMKPSHSDRALRTLSHLYHLNIVRGSVHHHNLQMILYFFTSLNISCTLSSPSSDTILHSHNNPDSASRINKVWFICVCWTFRVILMHAEYKWREWGATVCRWKSMHISKHFQLTCWNYKTTSLVWNCPLVLHFPNLSRV